MNKLETRKYKINLEGFVTPKNNDEFIKLLDASTKGEYESLSRFSMMNGYCKFIHKRCGNIFRTTPYRLLIKGDGCEHCQDKPTINHVLYENKCNEFVSHVDFIKKVFEKYGYEYVVTGTYEYEVSPIEIIHTKCGDTLKRTPFDILNSNSIICTTCNPRIMWDLEKIKQEILTITNGEFIVIDESYMDVDTPVKIKHKVCKQIFEDTPNAFMKTPKCKICEKNISMNEKRIKNCLIKNKVKFEREYSIDGCKNINLLKFDFVIFKKDKIMCLIEYDGEHHYYPVFGDESFVRIKIADKTKNKFCEENNIPLIRIPFWKNEKLEEVLLSEIRALGIIK